MTEHLFRHHYGKMVAVLTGIFGLKNLDIIEDAVQDTFLKALSSWRIRRPENPEAWLIRVARNRIVDLLRSVKAEKERAGKLSPQENERALDSFFLEDEIADHQLRMIFTACHPLLEARDQIAFSLKTISGFSVQEIASALLLKEETVKKRLQRARLYIKEKQISFAVPQGALLNERVAQVARVLYLIFNEGFHSAGKDLIVRKELCGEALRLCKMVADHPFVADENLQALFALMCFHSARLESKTGAQNQLIDLRNQDRSKWYAPLVMLGHRYMNRAVASGNFHYYHYEAAIASEHLTAKSFAETNWKQIYHWYQCLLELQPDNFVKLNLSVVAIQLGRKQEARAYLQTVSPSKLEGRQYLYYGTESELLLAEDKREEAISALEKAVSLAENMAEKEYLRKKLKSLY